MKLLLEICYILYIIVGDDRMNIVNNDGGKRMSNFDLMKIVSMFFILLWHFIHNTGLLTSTTGFIHFTLILFWFILIIHVNSFVMAMGYFQCEKKFRFSRLLSLNNAAWFYKVLFFIIFLIFGFNISDVDKLRLLSPLTLYNQYWFLATYLILYMISPFLNIVINNISKKKFQKMLLVLFLLSSVLTTISGQLIYNNIQGHSILTFVLLYYIGSYLKKYPIDINYYFKNLSLNMKRIVFVFLFMLFALLNTFIYHFGEELITYNNTILIDIGNNLINLKLGFDNPLVILQTVCFFLFFSTLRLKSKKVSYISSCIFAVYLIHDNYLVRQILYNYFYDFSYEATFIQVYGRIFIMSIIVFFICIFIEIIRKKIFSTFSKTRFSNNLRINFLSFLKSIGINLNW